VVHECTYAKDLKIASGIPAPYRSLASQRRNVTGVTASSELIRVLCSRNGAEAMTAGPLRIARRVRRYCLPYAMMLVVLVIQAPVLQTYGYSCQGLRAGCCMSHRCDSVSAPCSQHDCCKKWMAISPAVMSRSSETGLFPSATVATTSLLTPPLLNSSPRCASSPSPPLELLLRTRALRI
jgi:hypothetical protein